ncbi:MAG: exonuclease domain-containing protein [Hyphomicrobiales bacterium]
MLQLSRPIIFFDLETTGTNIKEDRIVEIAIIKVFPDGTKEVKTRKINPEIPIPVEASNVHGITDEDVKDEPTFSRVARSLAKIFDNCDLGGYNVDKFDLPLLLHEFKRVEVQCPLDEKTKVLDPMKIFYRYEPRDLTAAYKFYCNKELKDAHSAEADIIATLEVLEGQIEKYNLQHDIDSLIEASNSPDNNSLDRSGYFSADEDGSAIFKFGKYANQKVDLQNPDHLGYLDWMLKQDFPFDTHITIKKIIENITD